MDISNDSNGARSGKDLPNYKPKYDKTITISPTNERPIECNISTSHMVTSSSTENNKCPLASSTEKLLSTNVITGIKKFAHHTPKCQRFCLGQRALIGGVKPGILRYIGETNISSGHWCGIELFDASGLHDGTVSGRKYFSCKPFHGILAPVDKVVPDFSIYSSLEKTFLHQSAKGVVQ